MWFGVSIFLLVLYTIVACLVGFIAFIDAVPDDLILHRHRRFWFRFRHGAWNGILWPYLILRLCLMLGKDWRDEDYD